MDIKDITKLLALDHCHIFNPSIVPLSGDLYLLSYRICHYDIPVQLPPWRVWNDGYQFFNERDRRVIAKFKYRERLGPARRVPFQMLSVPTVCPEYDSTGLALIQINSAGIDLVANNIAPFGNEMNQDARLTQMPNGEIRISYNTFNASKQQLLRWRTLRVLSDEWLYEYDSEREMFESKQPVEKNCVFFGDRIIYAIGECITLITRGEQLLSMACPIRQRAKTHISSSTPPVAISPNRYWALGHIKIAYDSELLQSFLATTRIEIERHTQYVYFMFFYELDGAGRMTRLTPPFIPTLMGNHAPFLLAMPTGLCFYQGAPIPTLIVSYGEGDCRCKLLFLPVSEAEPLFRDSWDGDVFCYLLRTYRLTHLGYYNRGNTGDECFKKVFSYLQARYYPSSSVEFAAPDDLASESDLTIVGGGDVINDYFLENVSRKNVVAVGAGIPYASFEPYISRFKQVFLRDKYDAERLGTAWFPDLAFLLPKIYPTITAAPQPRVLGISVLQTYYHPSYKWIYDDYIAAMCSLIRSLIRDDTFSVVLFPFGVNKQKPAENDLIACLKIRHMLNYPSNVVIWKPDINNIVESTYRKMAQMDFFFCARFHSHIFATLLNIPFISLSLSRKCIQYMRMAGLEDNLYRLRANELDLPVEINAELIRLFFRSRYAEKEKTRTRLRALNVKYASLMKMFEEEYLRTLTQHAGEGEIKLYPLVEQPKLREAALSEWGEPIVSNFVF